MKFILDFDDTLFDAKKLKKVLNDCGIAEDAVSDTTFDEIKRLQPDFNLQTLVFADALSFLQKYKDDCEIVTTYLSRDAQKNTDIEARKRYQAKKIALCGITDLLGADHIHFTAESKKGVLMELKEKHELLGEESVYIDDRETYVQESEELGLRTFFMNRDKLFGPFEFMRSFERVTDISSFTELEEKLK